MSKGSLVGLGCLGIIVIVALVLGIAGIGQYNSLVTLSQAVDKQWSQVENTYQRRADLIPNLVAIVKGAAEFERGTLEAVTEARASVSRMQMPANLPNDPAAFARFEQAQQQVGSSLARLLVVVERYPDLKANQNFRDLQAQLEGTENRITTARNRYIQAVKEYNILARQFPSNLTAMLFGYKEKPSFTVENEKQIAEPPKVEFNKK
jgi:LemA protein